jgi:hypothetical protein
MIGGATGFRARLAKAEPEAGFIVGAEIILVIVLALQMLR